MKTVVCLLAENEERFWNEHVGWKSREGLSTVELCGSTAMAAFYISQEKLKDKSARRMYYGCVFKAKKEMPV